MGFGAWIEQQLRRWLPHKEIGWEEIGEKFTRFSILKTPWLNIYLHKLEAKVKHPHCHTHPWHFWAVILYGGYYEYTSKGVAWRGPGSILFRPAKFAHNVVTVGVNWSLVITSGRVRQWGFVDCEKGSTHGPPLCKD